MSDSYSPAFLLCWQVASLEAQAGTHSQIRPEHFFIALCKSGDLPIGALRDDGSPTLQAQLPQIQSELEAVAQSFAEAGFDPKRARRQVRSLLGQPGEKPADGVWHRSNDARWCCDRAQRIAQAEGNSDTTPLHLLRSFLDPEAHFPLLDQVITVNLRNTLLTESQR